MIIHRAFEVPLAMIDLTKVLPTGAIVNNDADDDRSRSAVIYLNGAPAVLVLITDEYIAATPVIDDEQLVELATTVVDNFMTYVIAVNGG